MSPEEEQKDVKKQGDKEAQDIADQLLADLLGNAPPAKKLETKPALAKEQKPAPAPPKVQPAEAPEPKPVEATPAPAETKPPAPKPMTPAPTPTAAPVAKPAPVPAPASTPKPEPKPEAVTPKPVETTPAETKPAPAQVAKPAEPASAPKPTPVETQPPAPKPEPKPEMPAPKPAPKPVEVEEEIEVPVQEDEVAPEEPLAIGGSVEFNPHVKKPRPQKKPEVKAEAKVAPRAKVHPMMEIEVAKVTINIGVGEAGEKILKAEKVLEMITKQKPVRTYSKTTNKDLGIRKDQEIGCKVTLRGAKAEEFLTQAFWVRENRIFKYSFDREGNFSFGIPDYTDFKGMKYDPDIGIFGMDISAQLKRKGGTRVKTRRIMKRHIPSKHRITHNEGVEFAKDRFQLEVLE